MNESKKKAGRLVGAEVNDAGISAVCLSSEGEIVDVYETSFSPGEETALHLGNFINELRKKFGDFDSIGIAVPGLVNRQTSRVTYSTHIPEHAEIDLSRELEKVSDVKIHIENDANAAAYGEHVKGAGRGSRNMFYATLGKGVGGALIFDNELWHGGSGFAGEFGYFAINTDGMRLEEVASAESIVERTKNRFHQDPTSSLNEIGEDKITIADVVREAQNEDDFAQLMLERTGFYVGTAIAGVVNLLNIEKIVVGGETMNAGEFFLEPIISRTRELTFDTNSEAIDIKRGTLGRNAAAIGAALLSQRENLKDSSAD